MYLIGVLGGLKRGDGAVVRPVGRVRVETEAEGGLERRERADDAAVAAVDVGLREARGTEEPVAERRVEREHYGDVDLPDNSRDGKSAEL